MSGKPWTGAELKLLRRHYGKMPVEDLAERLERTTSSVTQRAAIAGLVLPKPRVSERDQEKIRELTAQGLCNRCIGRAVKHSRKAVRKWRQSMGLPALHSAGFIDSCGECKQRVRAKTREQCRLAGARNLAEIRVLAYRNFAIENGWPAELRPREVQILNVLARGGVPMNRIEIARAIGMRTDRMGANGTLALLAGCNGPGGTYTASLLRHGLIDVLKRSSTIHGMGKGRSRHLYFLSAKALDILRERACREKTAN